MIGDGQPTAIAISDISLDLFVMPNLTPDVLDEDQVWALPIVQPLLGCLLVMETSRLRKLNSVEAGGIE